MRLLHPVRTPWTTFSRHLHLLRKRALQNRTRLLHATQPIARAPTNHARILTQRDLPAFGDMLSI